MVMRKPNRVTTPRRAVMGGTRTGHASMPRATGRYAGEPLPQEGILMAGTPRRKGPYPRDAVAAVFAAAGIGGGNYPALDPGELADQLRDALTRWPERFDGADRDMVSRVAHLLDVIADSEDS